MSSICYRVTYLDIVAGNLNLALYFDEHHDAYREMAFYLEMR